MSKRQAKPSKKTVERTKKAVERTKRAGIARIALNQPSKRNALDHGTVSALRTAVEDAVSDDEVRCIMLTGSSGAFCAGADLKEVAQHLDSDPAQWFRRTVDDLHATIERLHAGPKPVVTAINGPVAGGGLGLALSGDIRIASSQASFRSAYLRIGLSPDGASTYFLDRMLGLSGTQRFMLLDEPLDAGQAAAQGLVHQVVESDELEDAAWETARRLARLSPESVAAARGLLLSSHRQSLEDQMRVEKEALLRLASTENAREGIRAFLEKRDPDFGDVGETRPVGSATPRR